MLPSCSYKINIDKTEREFFIILSEKDQPLRKNKNDIIHFQNNKDEIVKFILNSNDSSLEEFNTGRTIKLENLMLIDKTKETVGLEVYCDFESVNSTQIITYNTDFILHNLFYDETNLLFQQDSKYQRRSV